MLYTDGTEEATREQVEGRLREMDTAALDVLLEANRQALQDAIDAATNINPLNLLAEKDSNDIVGTNGADSVMVVVEVPASGTAWEAASRNLIRNLTVLFGGVPLDADPTRARMETAKAIQWVAKIAASV